MKINSTAVIILTFTATLVRATNTGGDNPPQCLSTDKIGPSYDRDTINKGKAICNGDWKFGINSNGVFGLYDNDDLIAEFARNANWLKVHEKDGGEEVFLSVYKSGASNPIWEVKCDGLSGTEKTKLIINNNKRNVVRLNQGSVQNKLWMVDENGNDYLDGSYNCVIEEDSGDDDSDDISNRVSDDKDYELIVLRENDFFCIGVEKSNSEVDEFDELVLTECNKNDEEQLWHFIEGGTWSIKADPDLCVDVYLDDNQYKNLHLRNCDWDKLDNWHYDLERDDDERFDDITAKGQEGQCVAPEENNFGDGTPIIRRNCNSNRKDQKWDFVDPDDYVAPTSDDIDNRISDDEVDYEVIKVREDEDGDFCIGVYANDVDEGNKLVVTRCDEDETSQLWSFDKGGGLWQPMTDDELCVDVYLHSKTYKNLFLVECVGTNFLNVWHYNRNGENEITAEDQLNECVTPDKDFVDGTYLVRKRCKDEDYMKWDFFDASSGLIDNRLDDFDCEYNCLEESFTRYCECAGSGAFRCTEGAMEELDECKSRECGLGTSMSKSKRKSKRKSKQGDVFDYTDAFGDFCECKNDHDCKEDILQQFQDELL